MTGSKNVLLIPEKRQEQPLFDYVLSKSFSIHLPFCGEILEVRGLGFQMVQAKKIVAFRLVASEGQRMARISDPVHGMDLNYR